ncbi:threonine/serine exporter family protein [Sporomusa sp.]|uniref:threonine/serine exporter family protein n=1 Tax=Sporomusa sp. TaxID=2078658 RepID=UPI002C93B260|nr:threonine/serine exporter family protein [Sporomusa sp.]HWR43506.1 threonine/serine exporter family protein [Sporomusa sp.]
MFFVKVVAVLAMSIAIGVLYRIPRNLLVYASVTGVVGWVVMYFVVLSGVSSIMASFLGSLAVGLLAELLARFLKKPATIFIVPGFIPLVPGREAYTSMRFMVEGQYNEGVAMGMLTLLTGGAIAFGIFVSSTLYRLTRANTDYQVESRG